MRVHMFGSRLRVVLTLYLELGLNSTLDVAAWGVTFPRQGHIHTPFTSLCSGAEAKNNHKDVAVKLFHNKPSPGLLLLPNWLQDLFTYFIGCFDSMEAKILPAASRVFISVVESYCARKHCYKKLWEILPCYRAHEKKELLLIKIT